MSGTSGTARRRPDRSRSCDGGWLRPWHLADSSAPEDVRTLLKTLVRKSRTLNKILARNNLESVVERLLVRGLELFGEEMEPQELYEWFELVQAAHSFPGLILSHSEGAASWSRDDHWIAAGSIYGWLRSHRDIQLALVLEGLRRNASLPRESPLDQQIGAKFLGDQAPLGFRRWCLDTAVDLAATETMYVVRTRFLGRDRPSRRMGISPR